MPFKFRYNRARKYSRWLGLPGRTPTAFQVWKTRTRWQRRVVTVPTRKRTFRYRKAYGTGKGVMRRRY